MKLISENIDTIKSQIKEGIKFKIDHYFTKGKNEGVDYCYYRFNIISDNDTYSFNYTKKINLSLPIDMYTDGNYRQYKIKLLNETLKLFPFLKGIKLKD